MKASMTFVLVFAVVAAAFVLIAQSPSDQDLEQEQYCRMVWVHNHDARYGWPDFHHTYASECNANGTARGTR